MYTSELLLSHVYLINGEIPEMTLVLEQSFRGQV